jgi:ATP-binding cassette subfamily C protein CydD
MKVLRITFLSGFALELLSSLSVALIAVSIGLRLVSGDITLFAGLFVLLLAPEVYLPIRQVGVHFHAAAEGVTSSQKVLNIIDLAREQDSKTHEELVKDSAELEDFSTAKLNVIVGQSGAGKTTIFRNLLGLDGAPAKLQFAEVAWLPQQISLFSGSVLENIIGADELDNQALNSALKLACLDDLPLNYQLGDDASQVSGGQAQRIGLARCFYRVITKQTQYLMLDEPISALDQPRAISVVASLKQFVLEGKTVIAITHQGLLIDAAERVIEVGNA